MDETFLNELKSILFALDERVGKLEHTLNDVIIASWKEAAEEEARIEQERVAAEQRKAALEQFTANYPQVAELAGPLQALYGQDYDVYGDLYDTMQGHINDEGFDEKAYVDGQVNDVKGRLASVTGGNKEAGEEDGKEEEQIDEAQLARELAAAQ